VRPLATLVLAALLLAAGAAGAAGLKLTSRDLASAEFRSPFLYSGFGCTGGNFSPSLAWSDAPAATRSFAITLYDPDAPTGSGWWHWVVYDIPARVNALPAGAGMASGLFLPRGARQVRNDFGAPGYGGPCPPAGDKPHRYIFTLYALDVATLGATANASAALIGFNLHAHVIAAASLVIYHGRP
jgi:Raf kinase inhibitor-like YbhB/YbcL family protein